MSTLVAPDDREPLDQTADGLTVAKEAVERVAMDGTLTAADRAFLGSVASRLDAMAQTLRERATTTRTTKTVPQPKLPERHWTRKEAARVLKVHSNTLLNWEAAGLLIPKRDAKGWRVYGTAEIQRGMAILAHVPPDQLPGTE